MNGRADVGRDSRTCLAKTNSQARRGAVKIHILSVQLITSRIGDDTAG